eukprot:TRINITY_DN74464_c0_g1_i1.p2 TRINITY_DN74464_c0_g1~~TRINITY_DN74464_c0_g1_i1.p2  ORF type:complete len:139 (-),score=23.18 TRINITY_DN74464_c0_g1_i1:150-566(-)
MSDRIEGTFKFFTIRKGYGFIVPTGAADEDAIFCHRSDMNLNGLALPSKGEVATFVVGKDEQGRVKAVQVERPNAAPYVRRPRAPAAAATEGASEDAPKVATEGAAKKPRRRTRTRKPKAAAAATEEAPAAAAVESSA